MKSKLTIKDVLINANHGRVKNFIINEMVWVGIVKSKKDRQESEKK